MRSLLLLLSCLFLLARRTFAYNRPGCPGWPSMIDWRALSDSLDGQLHGPFNVNDYKQKCLTFQNQKNVALLKQGDGICMHVHTCVNKRCDPWGELNLPEYSVEAHSEQDVKRALDFANMHDIEVSVKSSGHTYMSQSSARGSLLIWLRHMPIDNTIADTTDTCMDTKTTIRINGGEPFDDAWYAVKTNYHMVTGNCQTVSFAGGWLQGGGMSGTHRHFGFGVDQVQSFRVMKADGSIVVADACTNEDLFWALRGGGGGNFGIVLSMQYLLHPPTKVVGLEFKADTDCEGFNPLCLLGGGTDANREDDFATKWIEFLVDTLPDLDSRWAGEWGPIKASFIFVGTLAEAQSSQWIIDMDAWYDNNPILAGLIDRPSSYLTEFDGQYELGGGDEAYDNPAFDGQASADRDYNKVFSRTIPRSVFDTRKEQLKSFLVDMGRNGEIQQNNYIYGGKTTEVAGDATALHPAMRNAVMEIKPLGEEPAERLRQFLKPDVTSVCYNHHSALEPNIEEAAWGSNYARLASIKAEVDPNHRFNVYHGVGYVETDSSCPDSNFFRDTFTTATGFFEKVKTWQVLWGASFWEGLYRGKLFPFNFFPLQSIIKFP